MVVITLLAAGVGAILEFRSIGELERADELWLDGLTGEAAAIYTRQLIWVEDSELPEAYERIITHHYDTGDVDAAKEWAEQAVEAQLLLIFLRDDLDGVFKAAEQAIAARKLAEEQARLAEERRRAEERERNKPNRAEMDLFYETVAATGRHGVIAELDSNSSRTLTIRVNNHWDSMRHATRLDYARTFRGAWRGVWPAEFGGVKVRIKIVDMAGKTIGEATWSEDAVWVY